jgi:predicted cupin superfamily sugar epimerase
MIAAEGQDAAYWVTALALQAHPEGGFFKESFRSVLDVPTADGGLRAASTAIYFLVTAAAPSRLHRLRTEELWHFYAGQSLEILIIAPNGQLEGYRLGRHVAEGEALQLLVPAGVWFGARVAAGGDYALCGCTMAPGFDFADFELGECSQLQAAYPHLSDVIAAMT